MHIQTEQVLGLLNISDIAPEHYSDLEISPATVLELSHDCQHVVNQASPGGEGVTFDPGVQHLRRTFLRKVAKWAAKPQQRIRERELARWAQCPTS